MMKRFFVPALLVLFALMVSSVAVGQEMKKEGEKKEGKEVLKSVSCAPECGFMVQSHDEKELTDIVIKHAKSAHNKDLTEADVTGMMKPVKVEKMMQTHKMEKMDKTGKMEKKKD
jgi:predicted small metal-binding protein